MTINVVCRKDAINKDHLAPLALVFTHDRRRKFVGLGMSILLEHWDFDKQQPAKNCPDGAEIQFQITSKIREYEKKIKKLEVLEIPVTFDNLFEQNGKRINCTVGDYFKQIIERLEKVEKYGSASKHKVTLALMSQFRSINMRFEELDLTYLREFEIFLRPYATHDLRSPPYLRHSTQKSGVNIAIISESLGHSDLSTTQIYLDSFENSQIDAAMQHLLCVPS